MFYLDLECFDVSCQILEISAARTTYPVASVNKLVKGKI